MALVQGRWPRSSAANRSISPSLVPVMFSRPSLVSESRMSLTDVVSSMTGADQPHIVMS